MRLLKKAKEEGVSLRLTFIIMLILSVAVTTMLLIMAYHTVRSFHALYDATDTYISLQEAASSLMSASDYLTEEAQCYTVLGDRTHLDNYFNEVEQTRRRENAVSLMESRIPESEALESLKCAMNDSLLLMNREYYAMRLMLSALGDNDIPEAMKDVVLTEEDEQLSAEEKQVLAERMMHDDEYYTQKNHIRAHLNDCIEELQNSTHSTQTDMEMFMRRDLKWMVILIIIQSLGLILMLGLTTSLGINPLLKAVEQIRRDQKLPIMGAHEFRYLARTYNKMYSAYKHSIEKLSFKASHDELTGVYNRAGFDLIINSVDPATTAFLLFDADRFKQINDEKGHQAGDLALKKIASTLVQYFRTDDYICRLGGDEFAVLMVHVDPNSKKFIEHKIQLINQELMQEDGEIPPFSLSVGISFCHDTDDTQEIYHEADIALYHVKDHGRNGCCFYTPELQEKS
ncbi:MAG: GGDEF domain-containing protein [Lachnospiraceae bacterium]|nr:GGDEF domain-containing protein [Lachnospiraceae bacterium]